MNANKQDAGGLPAPVWFNIRKGGHHLILFPAKGYSGVMLDTYMEMVKSAHDDVIDAEPLYTADQMRSYGELCRAVPAGSGEVGELIDRLETEARLLVGCIGRSDQSSDVRALRDAAALLRKLQQGADYVVVPREALSTEARRLRYRAAECWPTFSTGTDAGAQMIGTAEALERLASQGQEGGK